jgi:hypothetical protein
MSVEERDGGEHTAVIVVRLVQAELGHDDPPPLTRFTASRKSSSSVAPPRGQRNTEMTKFHLSSPLSLRRACESRARIAHQEFATARWTASCTRSSARSSPKRVGWRSKSRRIALPRGRSGRMQSGVARPRYASGHLAGRADPRAAQPERTRTWSSRRGGPAGTQKDRAPPSRGCDRCSLHRDAVCRRAPSSASNSVSIAPIPSCARALVAITGANA